MQRGKDATIVAIASRDASRARDAARSLGIPKAYGSYEELLADPDVEAVYNPLPNHLHVPWSIRAAEAGKHVRCEKPVSLDVAQAGELIAAGLLRDSVMQRRPQCCMATGAPWLIVNRVN